ncbi:HAD-IA family hydrolase [Herbiconiux sp. KACC 21604]|uniref:HAD family hydrolase n=1 Tax=unclassified Herbiconiux TaxID=2618217 RepID=UPI0014924689|nr:HAD-IA family hydrolase [Herbiconiux sp. SALV-R1]QJU53863.1 HAD-IA family hydrolase [Herbiconiux sp. SALV-R1]WPO84875.1 HAD-IA family hydrolase [Herbiconiux sp. KACC 21604]
MLLLLDLDNTLLDRAGAFALWAERFAAEFALGDGAVAWIVAADRNGHTPRPELAAAIVSHWQLELEPAALVERLVYEHVDTIAVYDGVAERLHRLADSGVVLVIVTNGPVEQQSRKIRRTGIDERMLGTVISEAVGVKKPERGIFDAAFELAGGAHPETWMVGDDVVNDMHGGRALGLRTGWVSHGAAWTESWRPTVAAETPAEVLDLIAGSGHPRHA